MNKIINLVGAYLEDFFIFMGLIWIIGTTYFINVIIASYLIGLSLLIIGWLIATKGKVKQKSEGR